MARMAMRFPDSDIAATLNSLAIRTGENKAWAVCRVGSIRATIAPSKAPLAVTKCPPAGTICIWPRPPSFGCSAVLSGQIWFHSWTGKNNSTAASIRPSAKRASRSHLKIRFALGEYRRATCATDTPRARVFRQIARFASMLERR